MDRAENGTFFMTTVNTEMAMNVLSEGEANSRSLK
jgi:hypothetical protein